MKYFILFSVFCFLFKAYHLGAQEDQLTFRTRVNYVILDVRITDQQGHFVHDLTQEDFEVFENGEKQEIETFELIDRGQNLENRHQSQNSRLFVIFLDYYHIHSRFNAKVRSIVKELLAGLNPNDLVALMTPLTNIEYVIPHNDHNKILEQVSLFQGVQHDYRIRNPYESNYAHYTWQNKERVRNEVSLSALRGLTTWLSAMRENHKVILLIGEGFSVYPTQDTSNINDWNGAPQLAPLDQSDSRALTSANYNDFAQKTDLWNNVDAVIEEANKWNTSIYTISTKNNFDKHNNTSQTLRVLSHQTQGKSFQHTQSTQAIQNILAETQSYYLIGYYSNQYVEDSKFQNVDVKVNRPHLTLLARKGYWVDRSPPPQQTAPIYKLLGRMAKNALSNVVRNTREVVKTSFSIVMGQNRTPEFQLAIGSNRKLFEENQNAEIFLNIKDKKNDHYYLTEHYGPSNIWKTLSMAPGSVEVEIKVKNPDGELLYDRVDKVDIPNIEDLNIYISSPVIYRAPNHYFINRILEGREIPTADTTFSRRDVLFIEFETYFSPEECSHDNSTAASLLNQNGEEIISLDVEKIGDSSYKSLLHLSSFPPRNRYLVQLSAQCVEKKVERFWAFDIL